MAVNTGLHIELADLAWMTAFTGKWLIIVVACVSRQTETGVDGVVKGFTVQGGRRPCIHPVACGAILCKYIAMRIRFGMTTGAIRGQIAEVLQAQAGTIAVLTAMAFGAIQVGMLSFERERGQAVIEAYHPIEPIMATRA